MSQNGLGFGTHLVRQVAGALIVDGMVVGQSSGMAIPVTMYRQAKMKI